MKRSASRPSTPVRFLRHIRRWARASPWASLGGTGMKGWKNCYHLHFGVLDQPDVIGVFNDRITRPIHFSQFESSPDRIKWTTMSGLPLEGTFVRRKTFDISPILR